MFRRKDRKLSLRIVEDRCVGCGDCVGACRKGVLEIADTGKGLERHAHVVYLDKCVGCRKCELICNEDAIELEIKNEEESYINNKEMKKSIKIWHALAFIAVVAAAIAIVMLLWNALIPSIVGWSAINYWQAAGLLVLCKLLFGGFGHRHHGFGGRRHHHHHHRGGHSHLHEKMHGMSHEEKRNYIRERMVADFRDFGKRGGEPEKTEE